MQIAALSFPASLHDPAACAHLLSARSLSLRAARTEDLPFLRDLYAQLRANELGQTHWPETVRQQFLDSQFSLQHLHFVKHFANADFYVVQCEGNDVGRLYLLQEPPYFHIIDIALLPRYRSRGLGTALLSWVKALTKESHADGIDLHVDQNNPNAQRLYEREGFIAGKQSGPYIGMRWSRRVAPQLNTA